MRTKIASFFTKKIPEQKPKWDLVIAQNLHSYRGDPKYMEILRRQERMMAKIIAASNLEELPVKLQNKLPPGKVIVSDKWKIKIEDAIKTYRDMLESRK